VPEVNHPKAPCAQAVEDRLGVAPLLRVVVGERARLPRARARPLTDYHSEHGCDSEAILNGLRARGFRVVHFRHYRPRCTAPIAWLDTVLQLDPEADFRLVAQAGTSLPQDGRCGATASSPP